MRFILNRSFLFVLIAAASGTSCAKALEFLPIGDAPLIHDVDISARLGSDAAPILRSDFRDGEITQLCKQALEQAQADLDALAKLPAESRGFDNTVLRFEKITADLEDATAPLIFMSYVSTQENLAAEASSCEQTAGSFNVAVQTRKDIYLALKDAVPRNDQERRLLSETLRGFEEKGLKLSDEKLARVKQLSQKLATLESQFSTNLNTDATTVIFTKEELDGVSPGFLNRLKKTPDGKFIVTTGMADYIQLLQNAKSGSTRKKFLQAYYRRGADKNIPILEEALALRQQLAALYGFKNWAEYRIAGRMAGNAQNAFEFLNSLKDKLADRNRGDLARLLKLKKELDPSATELHAWDTTYLTYQLKKRDYALDDEKIREYFPAETVIRGVFDLYSKLFGMRFVEVDGAAVWAPGVKQYRVINAETGATVAFFYTDLYPRRGKYSHAAAFSLISGRSLENGEYSKPVSALVANFNPPSNGKPSLLNHQEVLTVFHEFGHIMHQTLTRAPFASLSGTSVQTDFVEAPSQMLENWVWSPETMQLVSGHYLNPSEKLPETILDRINQARNVARGIYLTRQLMLALLDMNYHLVSSGPIDTTAIHDRLHREVLGLEPVEDSRFQASFNHLMGGYDAGYYGYLWSDVYAADMFSRFEAQGLLNAELGAHYRKTILEPGNMKENLDLLRDFLGRAPSPDAFFRKLGI